MQPESALQQWFIVIVSATYLVVMFLITIYQDQGYTDELQERFSDLETRLAGMRPRLRLQEVPALKTPKQDDEIEIKKRRAPRNAVVLESNIMDRGESCWLSFEHVRVKVLEVAPDWIKIRFERRKPASTTRTNACLGDGGVLAVPLSVYAMYCLDAAIAAERESEEDPSILGPLSLFPAPPQSL